MFLLKAFVFLLRKSFGSKSFAVLPLKLKNEHSASESVTTAIAGGLPMISVACSSLKWFECAKGSLYIVAEILLATGYSRFFVLFSRRPSRASLEAPVWK